MQLRLYQAKDLDALRAAYRRKAKGVVFVGPTGYGKTVLFSHIAKGAIDKGKRVAVLCHRAELIEQIVGATRRMGLDPSIVAPGHACQDAPLIVASVFTLINRLGQFTEPDLVIVDEAHHASLKTTWGKILVAWPNALRLGVTATPTRLSGEGLDDLFDTMVLGPTTKQLIDLGALTPVRVFAPTTPDLSGVRTRAGDYVMSDLEAWLAKSTITGDAVEHYQRLAAGKRAIAFCCTVNHAKQTAEAFNNAGIKAASIDGTMDATTRADYIARFRSGDIQLLTSCNLVSEGFDLPAIECGILLRPTKSLSLYLQQVGRCLRTFEGKSQAIILDHAGNAHKHGLPTDEREWTLKAKPKKKKLLGEIEVVKTCPSCFSVVAGGASVCEYCDHEFPTNRREAEKVKGTLTEITESRVKRKEQSAASNFESLVALGRMRGYPYPHNWARHVLEARKKRLRGRA